MQINNVADTMVKIIGDTISIYFVYHMIQFNLDAFILIIL